MAKNDTGKGKTALADKSTAQINIPIEDTKPPFFQSKAGKIVLGFLAFIVLFTIGYGLWRLSGGTFKPKTTCPDVATETRLRDSASANAANFTAQLEYADYMYAKCKKYDTARDAYQKAVTTANLPGSNIAVNDKAKAYVGSGLSYYYGANDLKAAQSDFKLALAVQPDNLTALYMLGTTYRNEDKVQAVNYFKRVVELAPDSDLGKSAKNQITELSK
jgi:tetratricopeptide (TPR) repeat protein